MSEAIENQSWKDREPKLETWQKLADFFEVSVPYLHLQGFVVNIVKLYKGECYA